MYMRKIAVFGTVTALSLLGSSFAVATSESSVNPADYSDLRASIKAIKAPQLTQPNWLKKKLAAEKAAAAGAHRSGSLVTVTYDVTTKGVITADVAQFKLLANQTLNDSRGWSRMNVSFKEVTSGGMFTLVLAQANQLPTFSSGCSSDWSCNAGRYVVINQDRWQGASASWNAAGGSLRDYRHMVVNHETGHWLGHSHEYCGGAGQSAPVMQQQSISLQGCKFNPWPLPSELWSSRLGI
jgi:hypothetical protein